MGRTSDARERLLESASQLFHDHGYTAVGVAEICDAAEVNKGSFYHFFPSKRELALEVIDGYWRGTRERLDAMLAADGPPIARLRRFLEESYEVMSAACQECGVLRGCPLGNLALELSTQDPVLRDRVRGAFDGYVDRLERLLHEARDRGEIPAGTDPSSAAEGILALIEGRLMLSKVRNDHRTLAAVLPEALRLVGARDQ